MSNLDKQKLGTATRFLAAGWLLGCLFFAWGAAFVKHQIFPYNVIHPMYTEVRLYWEGLQENEKGVADAILLDHQERKTRFEFGGLKMRDQKFSDPGYLLLSRYSKEHRQCIVELFSIATQNVLHTWVPDFDEIIRRFPELKERSLTVVGRGMAPISRSTYQCRHPMLLDGGDLLIQCVDGPLTRIDVDGNIEWQLNRTFHHSLEKTKDGNFVGCVVVEPQKVKTPRDVRDDGFAVVSPDGDILEEFSIMDIFIKNGFGGLIYGIGKFEYDRIHLNDAHPIVKQSSYANVGDVMLSCATISTIALFRPSTGKLLWVYTGPWMGQHDVNDLGDGTFSIFANNVVDATDSAAESIELAHSELFIYNPGTGTLTAPYTKIMQDTRVRSITEGRLRILENGDAYLEETNRSRLLRLSPAQVRWEYVNKITDESTGSIHWCRYLTEHEVDTSWIKE